MSDDSMCVTDGKLHVSRSDPVVGFDDYARSLGYIKLEPGQVVVQRVALSGAITELEWLASTANLARPKMWNKQDSATVRDFAAALEQKPEPVDDVAKTR